MLLHLVSYKNEQFVLFYSSLKELKLKMKVFQGIRNRMPSVGGSASKRDYVILGTNDSWKSEGALKPISLELTDGQRQEVKKETHDWMCRGLDFSSLGDGEGSNVEIIGTLELSDGSKEEVKIQIQTVC